MLRDGDAGTIIHQDQLGTQRVRKRQSLALTGIEGVPTGIINRRRNWADFKPLRRLRRPNAHDRRCVRVKKFGLYGHWVNTFSNSFGSNSITSISTR